jgi:hypothetical protein
VKSNNGVINAWLMVAFVETTAFGRERGVEEVVVKSFVPGVLFCVEVQPAGSAGGVIESKA